MSNALLPNTHNPDVLSCLANLSNDEVFTPPHIVNEMLDMLPQELFESKETTFLDPACKSGVFLREIAKRLLKGLKAQIPDQQERIDHIMHHQLYGIAITELTSLLARRSLYCSKYPNSAYSISKFDNSGGNIRFKKVQHTWKKGKCIYCGASQSEYDRDEALETHAYELIHAPNPEEIWNMKFDVIIGNPPYQLNDGGNGSSAMPIYQEFVEQSIKLKPRYLCMIVPSRWYAGGRGLDEFRYKMLRDTSIETIFDFPDAADCFPGVEIKGGVCYFLWNRDYSGLCTFVNKIDGVKESMQREMIEPGCETLIRYNKAIPILRKVIAVSKTSFSDYVSANDPFGYDVRVENSYKRVKPDIKLDPFNNSVNIYYYGWTSQGIGNIDIKSVRKNLDLIGSIKIFISRAYGAGESFPHQILGVPFLAAENSVCTETYLLVGPFRKASIAEGALKYISSRFFRFLVMLKKNTQSATQSVYQFVPMQDFTSDSDIDWNQPVPDIDKQLYAKYGLDEDEIAFIESMIRPMELPDQKGSNE